MRIGKFVGNRFTAFVAGLDLGPAPRELIERFLHVIPPVFAGVLATNVVFARKILGVLGVNSLPECIRLLVVAPDRVLRHCHPRPHENQVLRLLPVF